MNIFVAKLDYGVQESELETYFANYGAVNSCKIITDRETGRSKGFGFVEMSSDEEGQAAIDGLDGQEINGRQVVVKVAKPREDNRDRGGYNSNRY
ncbi:UNVERIFIED_CONTAM: hypothetical protein GTU68_006354 [Idotea baltica]|nr:hypothetical protein [Idotea baltica]